MTTRSTSAPTQESFDNLLRWLASNGEESGRAYETIRRRLVALFAGRGCVNAEDLADETINRVTTKIQQEGFVYQGEPVRYFYGVAKMVYLESLRRRPIPHEPARDDTAEIELRHECLEGCIEGLTPRSRQLVVGYYSQEDKGRFETRTELASKLGIPIATLRVQAHRIRNLLRGCMSQCLESKGAGS